MIVNLISKTIHIYTLAFILVVLCVSAGREVKMETVRETAAANQTPSQLHPGHPRTL